MKSSSLPPQIGDGRVCFVWGHGLGSTDPALRTRFNDGASEVCSALVIRSVPYYLCLNAYRAEPIPPPLLTFLSNRQTVLLLFTTSLRSYFLQWLSLGWAVSAMTPVATEQVRYELFFTIQFKTSVSFKALSLLPNTLLRFIRAGKIVLIMTSCSSLGLDSGKTC